ncbi:Cold shock domain-containing protein C2 [Trichoplax sp. H2]|uniref:CSD domain-containing protein n=1 Tax=Trichoplax adhaerens TaxID=10228 RepID=B3RN06_TRIAD|nr:hypothetical protein TRIADDRAFT_20474 [Trichoplax adhaerens]EDV27373.1 hypothetical protein TRIADDRAFT_20474 [Trichoplax adhaerens]RDD43935.1 Cold shock domain-containing protein C2 [Trichoplax sp. H2]|eukprot:XP_002109207.1 hypothetical protein TRIADDRAFT_20474 [Trichoplax adhaerens]
MAAQENSQQDFHFIVPSPVPTRRLRSESTHERAVAGECRIGVCHDFHRDKGHGFIKPEDSNDLIFVHISDINGEYVLKAGDAVKFKTCPLPPKCDKLQAVDVTIVDADELSHERWS